MEAMAKPLRGHRIPRTIEPPGVDFSLLLNEYPKHRCAGGTTVCFFSPADLLPCRFLQARRHKPETDSQRASRTDKEITDSEGVMSKLG